MRLTPDTDIINHDEPAATGPWLLLNGGDCGSQLETWRPHMT